MPQLLPFDSCDIDSGYVELTTSMQTIVAGVASKRVEIILIKVIQLGATDRTVSAEINDGTAYPDGTDMPIKASRNAILVNKETAIPLEDGESYRMSASANSALGVRYVTRTYTPTA